MTYHLTAAEMAQLDTATLAERAAIARVMNRQAGAPLLIGDRDRANAIATYCGGRARAVLSPNWGKA